MPICVAQIISKEELKDNLNPVATARIEAATKRGLHFARIKFFSATEFGKWEYLRSAHSSIENIKEIKKGSVDELYFIYMTQSEGMIVAFNGIFNIPLENKNKECYYV